MKEMKTLTKLFKSLAYDFVSTKLAMLWIRIFSTNISVMPGQIWAVPGVGLVLVRLSTRQQVCYMALEQDLKENGADLLFACDRIEFLFQATRIDLNDMNDEDNDGEDDNKPNLRVVEFNPEKNGDK